MAAPFASPTRSPRCLALLRHPRQQRLHRPRGARPARSRPAATTADGPAHQCPAHAGAPAQPARALPCRPVHRCRPGRQLQPWQRPGKRCSCSRHDGQVGGREGAGCKGRGLWLPQPQPQQQQQQQQQQRGGGGGGGGAGECVRCVSGLHFLPSRLPGFLHFLHSCTPALLLSCTHAILWVVGAGSPLCVGKGERRAGAPCCPELPLLLRKAGWRAHMLSACMLAVCWPAPCAHRAHVQHARAASHGWEQGRALHCPAAVARGPLPQFGPAPVQAWSWPQLLATCVCVCVVRTRLSPPSDAHPLAPLAPLNVCGPPPAAAQSAPPSSTGPSPPIKARCHGPPAPPHLYSRAHPRDRARPQAPILAQHPEDTGLLGVPAQVQVRQRWARSSGPWRHCAATYVSCSCTALRWAQSRCRRCAAPWRRRWARAWRCVCSRCCCVFVCVHACVCVTGYA